MPRISAHTTRNHRHGTNLALVGAAIVVVLGLLSLGTAHALTLPSASVDPHADPSVAPAHVALVDHGGAVLPEATVHAIWSNAANACSVSA